jgi:hypothetical protein
LDIPSRIDQPYDGANSGIGAVVTDKLIEIVESYFSLVRDVHRLGAGTKERSYYPAVAELLNAIGDELRARPGS